MRKIKNPNPMYRIEEMLEYLIRYNGRLQERLIACEERIQALEETQPSETSLRTATH